MSTRNVVRLAKEFVIKVGSMVVARCTDFSFSTSRGTIEVTSFDSDAFVEKLADIKDWNLSFGSMVTREIASGQPGWVSGKTGLGSGTLSNLLDLYLSATGDYPVVVAINESGGSAFIEGYGLLQGMNIDGSVGDKATYGGTIEGAGEFVRGTLT
jgi:hypothetical protein